MVKLHSIGIDFDALEHCTVTAALMLWRDHPKRPEELEYLACNFGETSLLDPEEIDALIEKVRTCNGLFP